MQSNKTKTATFQWYQTHINSYYNKDETETIEKYIAHYMNRFTGFGNTTGTVLFEEASAIDPTEELHKIAMIGVEIEKQLWLMRNGNKVNNL